MTHKTLDEIADDMEDAPDEEYFAWFDRLTRDEQAEVLSSNLHAALFDCGYNIELAVAQIGMTPLNDVYDLVTLVLRRRRWRGKVDLKHLNDM